MQAIIRETDRGLECQYVGAGTVTVVLTTREGHQNLSYSYQISPEASARLKARLPGPYRSLGPIPRERALEIARSDLEKVVASR